MSIKSIGSLYSKQVDSLIKELDETEFKFSGLIIFGDRGISRADRTGYIYVKYPKFNHPVFSGVPLPVGFILPEKDGKYDFSLVNINKRFFTDYHSRLREIYNSV